MFRLLWNGIGSFYTFLFKPDQFKVRLQVGNHLEFVIYECPGLWATDDELDKLTGMLNEISVASQSGKDIPNYGVLTGGREDLKTRIISIAIDLKKNKPVGFSAQSYLDITEANFSERLIHLGLIFIDPSFQGKNISYLLALFPNIVIMMKSGFRDVWISNVSQVPAICGLVACNYSNVYPNALDGTQQSFYHRYLSKNITSDFKPVFGVGEEAEFDSKMQVWRNSYTGGSDSLKKSFFETPKHRKKEINDMCEKNLDYDRGDDFVQVGQLSVKAFVKLFSTKVKNQSRLKIFMSLFMFRVLSFVLPIFRWFIPRSDFHKNKQEELPLII